jgi:hypothetical protein
VFAGFPVIEIDVVMRRTLRSAVVLAIVAVVAAIALGQPLVAPGVVVGLILAIGNHRVFQASAMRFTTPEGTVQRKPFASSVLARLGACTAVAGLLLVFVRPMGWGVIGGLVAFQMLLLLNATVALLKYQRSQMTASGDHDA